MRTFLKSLLVGALLFFPSQVSANYQLLDEGSNQGYPYKLDCVGAGISCSRTGSTGTVTVTGGGGATFVTQEEDVTVDANTGTLDFQAGFDATSSPAGEANISLDLTEITVDANTLEGTDFGTLTDGNFCTYDLTGTEVDCATAQNAGTDITADLEEETHASEHLENATDELTVEGLGTACTVGQTFASDGSGGVDCSSGSSSAYDDIADPDAISSINFSGFTNTWTSTIGNATFFTIDGSGTDFIVQGDGDVFTDDLDVTGAITVSSTVDGRDLQTDGTKLDGIEAGATEDQTAEEIEDAAFTNSLTGNTETDITVTYQVADNTVDFVVDTLPNLTGTLDVDSGGTGATSLTDGGILLGSGTGPITALGVATNGQIPIGDGTTDPQLATITGGNDLTVVNGAASITLNVDDAFIQNDTADSTSGLLTMNAGAEVKQGATAAGFLRFYEDSDDGSNYTEIQGVATAANLEWILPASNGTAGQVLEIASVASNTLTLEWDDDGGGAGGGGVSNYTLPVQSAKISGSFATKGDATQGATIDAADGNWRLLFDATTDEGAVWQFVMPDNYSSAPKLDIHYSMASATTNEVEFEGAIACVSDGDAVDVGADNFAAIAVGSATVPGTAGHKDVISITLTDDSCAASDSVWIYLSTDADDANDDATGDREVIFVEFNYTSS